MEITDELTLAVERLCGCGFNSSLISNSFLSCFDDSPQHVTYRAVLTGTPTLPTVELASLIHQWTRDTRNVIVQSAGLSVNSTCPLVIVDRDSPECPKDLTNRSSLAPGTPPPSGEIPLDIGPIVGGVIGGLVGLVTMAVLIIVVVVLSLRHHRSGSRDVETKDKE